MNTRNIGNEAKINPKTGRIDQACERYGVGRSTMRRIAEESGAVVRVGRTYLINYSKVDQYISIVRKMLEGLRDLEKQRRTAI